MKRFVIAMMCAAMAIGQDGTPMSPSQGPPYVSYSTLLYYSGSDLIYTCKARSVQPLTTFARTGTAVTLTDIVDSTNTGTVTTSAAHGLAVNDKVTVSGATVDTDLNGVYAVVSVGSTTSFTITTASVSDATYSEATLKVTTTAPRDTAAIWSMQKFTYVAAALTATQWANGTSATNQICANRATLTYQ